MKRNFFFFSMLSPKIVIRMIKPLITNVPHRIETSQVICSANQLTGFYVTGKIDRYWVKLITV